ncbi:MAG: hypothetical protein EOO40_05970, partial [Deltaproteobacteria bacterium]
MTSVRLDEPMRQPRLPWPRSGASAGEQLRTLLQRNHGTLPPSLAAQLIDSAAQARCSAAFVGLIRDRLIGLSRREILQLADVMDEPAARRALRQAASTAWAGDTPSQGWGATLCAR